jgi:peptidoglycan/xylan/chitin deacetylase (PgdA/CDA1 family)
MRLDRRELLSRLLAHRLVGRVGRLAHPPGLVVLTYHRVANPDDLDDDLRSATPSTFRAQLRWLRDQARVLSGAEVEAWTRGALVLREPAVCVTFDDGYHDNLAAAQAMHELGVPGIFFVTTGFVGTPHVAPWDRVAWAVKRARRGALAVPATPEVPAWTLPDVPPARRLAHAKKVLRGLPVPVREAAAAALEHVVGGSAMTDRPGPVFMAWDEVRALAALGHTVGAHTHTHAMLARLSGPDQLAEMVPSRDTLAAELGRPVTLFAYPFGKAPALDQSCLDSARAAGFAGAFSFHGGYNPARVADPFDIKRVGVSVDQSQAHFQARVNLPALFSRN